MSFELTINKCSQLCKLLLMFFLLFCVLLTWTASIVLPVKTIAVLMFIVVYYLWRMRPKNYTKLTFDGVSWYIDSPECIFSVARLLSVRNFPWCRVFDFMDEDGDRHRQVIWQDQVSVEIWRRLAVFHTLKAHESSYH